MSRDDRDSLRQKRHRRSRSRSRSHESDSRPRKSHRDQTEKSSSHSSNETADIPIATCVTDANGEISCSVEESNRIRELLGLKPLKVDNSQSSEAQAVQNFKQKAEEEKRVLDAAEAKSRIEKARKRRLLHSKVGGAALSDMAEDEKDIASAADWVKRSRKRAEETKKEKEERLLAETAKRLEALDEEGDKYDASALKGIDIMHGESSFKAGESVILTLADSNILDTDERGNAIKINEDGDVLENIDMTAEEKRLDREKKLKRSRQPVYAGYDDAEFEEGVAPGVRPNILSQYDEEVKRKPQLRLGEDGVAVVTNSSDSNPATSTKGIPQSLQTESSSSKAISEYLTPAEYATFHKPKKDKTKKKRKIRKKDSGGIIEELEAAMNGDESQSDRGSRKQGAQSSMDQLKSVESERRSAYANAVKSAAEKSTQRPDISSGDRNVSVAEVKEDEDAEDDDADIAQSLARARRLAQKKNRAEDLISKAKQSGQGHIYADESFAVGTGAEDESVDAEGRRKDGKLVFTSTTEFTTRLQARLQEKARSKSAAAVKEMELADSDDEGGGAKDNSRDRRGHWVDVEDANDEEQEQEEVSQEEDKSADAFGHQPAVAKGMAATLELLKGSGDLQKKKELAGRAKDTRAQDPSSGDLGVKIEYRDEFGRKLTQKEAFRQLSYKFHGIKPGAKKKAKRLKEYQDEMRASKQKSETSATMLSLTRAQEATGKAHVTVQGGVK